MIGTSLPLSWLAVTDSADRAAILPVRLPSLRAAGVKSIELRTVRPETSPGDVLAAAQRLWRNGFRVTVHGTVMGRESAVTDVYAPLATLLDTMREQNRVSEGVHKETLTVTIHPTGEDDAGILCALIGHAREKNYPVRIALENNRVLPGNAEGDCAKFVLDAVKTARERGYHEAGICFDMGHWLYYVKKNAPGACVPPKEFFPYVIHTHIHGLDGLRTHFPLCHADSEALVKPLCDALSHGYFGVYNLELDFPRFAELYEPETALLSSLGVLKRIRSHCAMMYDDIRENFDGDFHAALAMYDLPAPETPGVAMPCDPRTARTLFAQINSASYLFRTDAEDGTTFRWGMDVAFRWAWELAETPHRVGGLLSCLDLMLISHGHDDHFEPRTVRLLAKTGMRWVIPDFLYEDALRLGIRAENILTAHKGEELHAGPLTILPFEGRHYRPGTQNGLPEYGYRVTADGNPALLFPVDTRDYRTEYAPDVAPGDYCFADIWLGDGQGLTVGNAPDDFSDIGGMFADFMLHFSRENIVFAHMYENGRADRDLWRREHAELLSRIIKEKSPGTRCRIPVRGKIYTL
ncbi:MAG: MBL fold metallo-hydrolase [Clostridia bacterium]|nr:MBL fold metallo-hydrolase [Clostridia bacterium]